MAKQLSDMTVAEAAASGQTEAYNQLVSNIAGGNLSPLDAGGGKTYAQISNTPITPGEMSSGSSTIPKLPSNTKNNWAGVNEGTSTYVSSNGIPEPTKETATDKYVNQVKGEKSIGRADILAELEDEAGIEKQRKSTRNLKARIDSINAEAQSAKQTLESQAGTGKDVTSSFLGRQQQEIDRQAAIQTLPLTAQYQAELGDLQAAEKSIDRLYELQVKDLEDERDTRLEVYKIAYERANDEEKQALEERWRQEDYDRELKKADLDFAREKELTTLKSTLNPSDKKVTGVEKQALAFYNRAESAITDIEKVESDIAKLGLIEQGRLKYAPNFAQSDTGKLYNQAQRAFTEARLRKESGAAIPESEFENDRTTYFAQPGDTTAVLNQKKVAREQVLAGMKYAAGNAYEDFYGFPPSYEVDTKSTVGGSRISVIDPDGNVGTIPEDQLDEALASGYKRQ